MGAPAAAPTHLDRLLVHEGHWATLRLVYLETKVPVLKQEAHQMEQHARAREYRLNAPLSRRVRSEEARAKWSKKLSALVVTIPVVGSGGGKE